jgi:hypothetical protein
VTSTAPDSESAPLPDVPYGPASGAKVQGAAGAPSSAHGGRTALKIALRLLLPILVRVILRGLSRR